MDKLEKYIRENRDQWDDQKAPAGAWDKIVFQTDHAQGDGRRFSFWKKVLIGLITIAIATGAFLCFQQNEKSVDARSETLEFATIPEIQETQQYYRSTIELNLVALKKLSPDATLLEDLSHLDKIERELRQEYENAQGIHKEDILHALIANHQTKLGILEKVLIEIKNKKKQNNEIL